LKLDRASFKAWIALASQKAHALSAGQPASQQVALWTEQESDNIIRKHFSIIDPLRAAATRRLTRNDDTHGLTSYARLIDDNTLYNACFVCKSRFLFSHDMKTPCIPGNGKMEKRKRKRRRREEEKKLEKSHGSAQPYQQVVRYAYLLSRPSSPYFVTFVRCSSRFVKFLSDSTHFCSVFPISVHFFPPPTPELAASFDWSFFFDRALEPDGLDRVWSFQRSRPRAAHALISSSAR